MRKAGKENTDEKTSEKIITNEKDNVTTKKIEREKKEAHQSVREAG